MTSTTSPSRRPWPTLFPSTTIRAPTFASMATSFRRTAGSGEILSPGCGPGLAVSSLSQPHPSSTTVPRRGSGAGCSTGRRSGGWPSPAPVASPAGSASWRSGEAETRLRQTGRAGTSDVPADPDSGDQLLRGQGGTVGGGRLDPRRGRAGRGGRIAAGVAGPGVGQIRGGTRPGFEPRPWARVGWVGLSARGSGCAEEPGADPGTGRQREHGQAVLDVVTVGGVVSG